MPKSASTRDIGDWGERKACKYLQNHGYTIVERNYHTRAGEIDIIAAYQDNQEKSLNFIEVKTRSSKPDSGEAEHATKATKKFQKMMTIARQYCSKQDKNLSQCTFNFEHISVYVDKKGGSVSIKKYPILN
ncbi:MAG: YraN family protein [Candidatus Magasanikbacteria bacterium]